MKCYGDNPINKIECSFIKFSKNEPEHTHGKIEMVYIVSGMGEQIVDGQKFIYEKGSMIMINTGQTHAFNIFENTSYINILFDISLMSDELNSGDSLSELFNIYGYELDTEFFFTKFSQYMIPKIEEIAFNILAEYIKKDYAYENVIKAGMEQLIHLFVREFYNNKKIKNNLNSELKIEDAMRYIQENCLENLRLEDVSKIFNCSPNYFSYILKKKYGLSFKQLLIEKRLSIVIYYLLETNYSIGEIQTICGFNNTSYFYKLFERHFGVKPKTVREYKRNYIRFIDDVSLTLKK